MTTDEMGDKMTAGKVARSSSPFTNIRVGLSFSSDSRRARMSSSVILPAGLSMDTFLNSGAIVPRITSSGAGFRMIIPSTTPMSGMVPDLIR